MARDTSAEKRLRELQAEKAIKEREAIAQAKNEITIRERALVERWTAFFNDQKKRGYPDATLARLLVAKPGFPRRRMVWADAMGYLVPGTSYLLQPDLVVHEQWHSDYSGVDHWGRRGTVHEIAEGARRAVDKGQWFGSVFLAPDPPPPFGPTAN